MLELSFSYEWCVCSSMEEAALVTSSIFAYPRRTTRLLARTVEWREGGKRGDVRRHRIERIKTSRKQVRSDPPGKFKRTFYRVVITRIRVARARAVEFFSWPRSGDAARGPEAWPSYLEFMPFNGGTATYYMALAIWPWIKAKTLSHGQKETVHRGQNSRHCLPSLIVV